LNRAGLGLGGDVLLQLMQSILLPNQEHMCLQTWDELESTGGYLSAGNPTNSMVVVQQVCSRNTEYWFKNKTVELDFLYQEIEAVKK